MSDKDIIVDLSTAFANVRDAIHNYENKNMASLSPGQVAALDSLAAHVGVASQTIGLFAIIGDLDPDGTLIPKIKAAAKDLKTALDKLDAIQRSIKTAIALATAAASLGADVAAKALSAIPNDLKDVGNLLKPKPKT